MRSSAEAAWNQRLNLIQVDGAESDEFEARRTVLYSALYHAFLHPNIFSDANGDYLGFDDEVHHVAEGHAQYHNVAGWDQYRSLIRLWAMLTPDETSDVAQSLVNDAQQGDGTLPRWEQTNHDSRGMNGDGGSIIVAEAYAFGARAFDARAALQAAISGQSTLREGDDEYVKLGYVPSEAEGDSTAITLEYSQADAATAQFARALGDDDAYTTMLAHSHNWRNLYNPETGYVQPRQRDGSWATPFDPTSQNGFQEGSAAQYIWLAPEPGELMNLLGGADAMNARLDDFFMRLNEPAESLFAFMGNEVDLQSPWLYCFTGAPDKAQALLSRIESQLYPTGPKGLPGNDDGGALSSFLIFSQLGLYPWLPGTAGFVVGSPAFDTIRVTLPGGVLHIESGDSSQGPYISKLEIDGAATHRPWVPWEQLAHGAVLRFTRSDAPTAWGTDRSDGPPSP